ncbi:MAG: phosphatidylserine decarboxylase [Verrucomicrobiota bacterium]
MKHCGKAASAAWKWIFWSILVLLGIFAAGIIATYLAAFVTWFASGFIALWIAFVALMVYFFRDPEPSIPQEPGVVLSPAHGTVDVVDETEEKEFMGGRCQRISIFLSPLDVHVQRAPVSGRVGIVRHQPGEFKPATSPTCGLCNENVLIGFDSTEVPGEKISIRLIAGILARRIIPWSATGELVARGERISLIQFGSRCDVYLPRTVKISVKLGDKVIGGETILARRA